MPIYNPSVNWEIEIVRQIKVLMDRLPDNFVSNLILVNDGSDYDLSSGANYIKSQISKSHWISYAANKGKGYALRKGVESSKSDFILLTDHDVPYTYGSMIEILEVFINVPNAKVVIGHRDKFYYEDMPFLRVKVSHYLKTINRFILQLNTDDTQCGLKAFHKSIKSTFLETKTNRFLIDIEFLRRLRRKKINIEVIDVRVRENIVLSKVGFKTMLYELFSYLKIILTT